MIITKQKNSISEKEHLIMFKKINQMQIFKLNFTHFSSTYLMDFLVSEPVDFMLRPSSVNQFNLIFQNLFKIKFMENLMSKCFSNFKSNTIKSTKYKNFTKRFNYFTVIIKTIHKYIFECIYIKWDKFKNQLNETVDVEDYLHNQQEFLSECVNMFNENQVKIVLLLNKIHKKFCKLHLQLINFSEEQMNIRDNENLILIIMEKLNNHIKILNKCIFEDKSNGDFFKLKHYLNFNQIY